MEGVVVLRWSLLFFQLSIIPKSKPHPTYLHSFCSTTTFTPNSKYQTNLNTLFHSLSSNATSAANPSGFYNDPGTGTGDSDTVYGLFMCRGDINSTACHDCVTTATTTDLPKTYCRNGKSAVIWYDECMVRYSNESLFDTMEESPKFIMNTTTTSNSNSNPNNFIITGQEKEKFIILVNQMMRLLASRAATEYVSGIKFGTNETRFTDSVAVYALAQCTPDLMDTECNQCLLEANRELPVGSAGSRVLFPSCNVRYDMYPFYNGAVDLSVAPRSISGSRKQKVSGKVIAAIVVPVTVVALAILVVGSCHIKKKAKYGPVVIQNGEDFTNIESLQYDLPTLQSATDNFSDKNKLGEGGFGAVYKGILPNGQEIAVKRLSGSSNQGVEEFKNEVLVVAKLQHRNLVRLMGYCLAGEEKLLVYEYVANKSLDYFLFDPQKCRQLDWGRRYKIIAGVARGMLYLHQDSRLTIIHRDLKSSNVLLDADLNPKIADFGMARIVGVDQPKGSTNRVVGTYGYMAPEYAMHGKFSVRSDVYSFGVLVLEIVSGKRNSGFYEPGYAEDLLNYAWKQWRTRAPLGFVDPTLRDSCSRNEVMRCLHLGLLCVQESINERPTMAKAVLMLDSNSVTLPMPEEPAFFINKNLQPDFGKNTGPDQSPITSVPWSTNDVSITEIEPR